MEEQKSYVSENNYVIEIEKYIIEDNLIELYDFIIKIYNENGKWAIDLSKDNNIIISRYYMIVNKIEIKNSHNIFLSSYFYYLYLYNNITNHNTKENDSFYSSAEGIYLKLDNFTPIEKNHEFYFNSLKKCVTNYKLELFIEKIKDRINKNELEKAFNTVNETKYNLNFRHKRHFLISEIILDLRKKCLIEINLNFKKKEFQKTLQNIILFNKILNLIDSKIEREYYNNIFFKNKLYFKNTKISIYSYCLMKIYNEDFIINPDNLIFQKMLFLLNSYFKKRSNNEVFCENEKKIFLNCCYIFEKPSENDDLQLTINKMINNVNFYYEDFQYLKHNHNDSSFYLALEHYIYKNYFLAISKNYIENYFKSFFNSIEINYTEGKFQNTIILFENYFSDAKHFNNIIIKYDLYFMCILKTKDENFSISENSTLYKFYHNFAKIENLPDKDISNKFIVYNLSSFFYFGKYYSKKLIDVYQIDKDYILWCIINLNNFVLDEKEFLLQDFKDCKLFLKAVESNLIKLKILKIYLKNQFEEEEYFSTNNSHNHSENYSIEDSYHDGGGGDEWSDPSEFW